MPRCLIYSRFPRVSARCYERPGNFLILTNSLLLSTAGKAAIRTKILHIPFVQSVSSQPISTTTSKSRTTMSDSENDEDLKKAIALSLGETLSPVPIREKNVVDLTTSPTAISDSKKDEDLKKAIALSEGPSTMFDSESDEDLKRAIALSSRETLSPATIYENKVVDLTNSDEDGDDDDLDAPVATHFKFPKTNPVLNTCTDAEPSTSSQSECRPLILKMRIL